MIEALTLVAGAVGSLFWFAEHFVFRLAAFQLLWRLGLKIALRSGLKRESAAQVFTPFLKRRTRENSTSGIVFLFRHSICMFCVVSSFEIMNRKQHSSHGIYF